MITAKEFFFYTSPRRRWSRSFVKNSKVLRCFVKSLVRHVTEKWLLCVKLVSLYVRTLNLGYEDELVSTDSKQSEILENIVHMSAWKTIWAHCNRTVIGELGPALGAAWAPLLRERAAVVWAVVHPKNVSNSYYQLAIMTSGEPKRLCP